MGKTKRSSKKCQPARLDELTETIIYDAMALIEENSSALVALVRKHGTAKEHEAYQLGVYAPCVKLQVLLGSEAMARGKARHEEIAGAAKAWRQE